MVGTAQPLCLSASGTQARRYDSTMNLRKTKTHSVSLHDWGWTARPFILGLTAVRELFVLTSPFIERGYRNVGNDRLGNKSRIPITGLASIAGVEALIQRELAIEGQQLSIGGR